MTIYLFLGNYVLTHATRDLKKYSVIFSLISYLLVVCREA